MQILFSPAVLLAEKFCRSEIAEGMSLEEFESKFPKGSEGYGHFINLACFWETVGYLMKEGLLNQDLAFSTFLDGPPWNRVRKIFLERRERDDQPMEGINFEWVGTRAKEWIEEHERKMNRKNRLR